MLQDYVFFLISLFIWTIKFEGQFEGQYSKTLMPYQVCFNPTKNAVIDTIQLYFVGTDTSHQPLLVLHL